VLRITKYKHVTQVQTTYEYRELCRELFKALKMLSLSSQYIFSLLLFIVKDMDSFVSNSVYNNNNNNNNNNTKEMIYTLAMYQKGVYYAGIKIFNSLLKTIKDISSKPNKFIITL